MAKFCTNNLVFLFYLSRSLISRIIYEDGSVQVVHIPLDNSEAIKQILSATAPRKIVYDGKTLLKSLAETISDFSITSGDLFHLVRACRLVGGVSTFINVLLIECINKSSFWRGVI